MIFKENQTEGMGNFSPDYLADMVIKNGYLYYAGIRDYKLYLMRRSLENPSKEEILGEAFFDSGISRVGTIESYHSKIYSSLNPDFMIIRTDVEWLKVDERFQGADLNSEFYLTEKGIVFYYEPYVLAPGAEGFQEVTIPYEEFAMKISLGRV